MTSWLVLHILASFVAVAVGEGSSSICSTRQIQLDSYSTVHLHSPKTSEIIGENCSVQINASSHGSIVRLNITSFDLGGRDPCSATQEHLMIVFSKWSHYNKGDVDTIRWCGQSYAPVLETREVMVLTYFPGPDAQRGRGFTIQLSVVQSFQCGLKPFSVGLEPMYIYSPGYPAPYDINIQDCEWIIKSKHRRHLLLDSLRFALERHNSCAYDYLRVNGATRCGYERLHAASRLYTFELYFHTDHSDNKDGFVLRLMESPPDVTSCHMEVTAGSSPILLELPSLVEGQVNNINCWWLLDSGSDDSVVLLDTKQFHSTAPCSDFELQLFDAKDMSGRRILSGCGTEQMFQTVRSSSRYLFLDVVLTGFGHFTIDVSFTVTASPQDAAPRVLYASFAASHVWLDLGSNQDLGLLVRGNRDDPEDYSTCVHLSVRSFPSENHQALNASGYFYAFSGWNESFAELGTGCGRTSSQDLVSRGSYIFIKFFPRLSSSARYVWLTYRLKRDCEPEVVSLQADTQPKGLLSDFAHQTSSGGLVTTMHYPNNAFCRWLIHPLSSSYFTQVKAIHSKLYEYGCYDNVTTYDYDIQRRLGQEIRLLEWCGTETPVVLSSKGNGVLLEFISNYRRTETGFGLEYSSVSLIDQCPSMASLTAEEDAQYLTSPNHPYTYPNNVDCKWRITSKTGTIRITLLFVSIAQEMRQCEPYDSLIIYDGWDTSSSKLVELCGNNFIQSTYLSSSIYLLVHFRSDQTNAASGFRLTYQTSDDPIHWGCNRNVYVTVNQDREITSPFYPNPYPSDTNCYWLVLAPLTHIVMLEVLDIDLPSCQDSPVLLYDGQSEDSLLLARVCGSQHQNRYTTTQKSMYINFRANGHTGMRGFRFRLRSWTYNGGCEGEVSHLMAYTAQNYITSPQYPSNYPPGSDCLWRIESAYRNMTVRLDIEDAKLESSLTCNFDSVSIYDGYDDLSTRLGKFCGDHFESFWSSGIYMYVRFVSDSSTQYRGFRLAYRAVLETPPPPIASESESSSSIGAVLGGVFGGVVLLLVGITVFLCFLGRCQRCRSGAAPAAARHPASSSRDDRGSTVFVMSPVIVNQMPPPPYPGLANPGYLAEDPAPPAYPFSRSLAQLPPPPLYAEIDAPPPYSDAMMESHPPSSPTDPGPDPVADGDGQSLAASGVRPAVPRLTADRDCQAVASAPVAAGASQLQQQQQQPPSAPPQERPPALPSSLPQQQPPPSPPVLLRQPPPPPLQLQQPAPPQAPGVCSSVQPTPPAAQPLQQQDGQTESSPAGRPVCRGDSTDRMAESFV